MSEEVEGRLLILGLGKTGFSFAKYFASQGIAFSIADSRQNPPYLNALKDQIGNTAVYLGPFKEERIFAADTLLVSPGVDLNLPVIQKAKNKGISIIGDIELFCRKNKSPIIAVTGSNGKSTVASLVALMAKKAGLNVGLGGNIGNPVLDFLKDKPKSLYVLELSSYQLESLASLRADAAVMLNLTPDHLERHQSLHAYRQAKLRIYKNAKHQIVNIDEPYPEKLDKLTKVIEFGLKGPADFCVSEFQNESWIMAYGQPFMPIAQLKIKGQHNLSNVLAALALAYAAGLPKQSSIEAITEFKGLPHRCQPVLCSNSIEFVNDSKATNVESTLAAINGLGKHLTGKLILILGGRVKKNSDFTKLNNSIINYVRQVILIGEGAVEIGKKLPNGLGVYASAELSSALALCLDYAKAGDTVLFSPACPSFDQYENFEHRGEVFIESVRKLNHDS